ncbi:hypothetical protein SKAU_G00141110 [Synaphobranchus kaupii]|uniref:Uncharacterized protein n=1 Tax=Synaphobranchus kaupii TaxID=118154 RepID=A0A9Q1FT63_SYNKA|nr:hypothetical protein SKAU_G00141110 [Synaphobranchus kaupii]
MSRNTKIEVSEAARRHLLVPRNLATAPLTQVSVWAAFLGEPSLHSVGTACYPHTSELFIHLIHILPIKKTNEAIALPPGYARHGNRRIYWDCLETLRHEFLLQPLGSKMHCGAVDPDICLWKMPSRSAWAPTDSRDESS